MVPEGTNSARSLPSSSATRSSSARTLGSSPYTSSPTSAAAITRRISAVGRVTVSERKSITGIARSLTLFVIERRLEQLPRQELYGLRQVDRRLVGRDRDPQHVLAQREL